MQFFPVIGELCREKSSPNRIYITTGLNIMKIEHLGLWVQDLELMRNFYLAKYFDTSSGEKLMLIRKAQFHGLFYFYSEKVKQD